VPEEYTPTVPKPFVFVLMPFDSEFRDVYEIGIKEAAQVAGAYAERLDEQMFNEGMLERVFNQISKADVIVADMTGRNPNVFYEVGYAHALGQITLLLTRDAADIPFDLKHRPHIVYADLTDLREQLSRKIAWAIDEAKKTGRHVPVEQFAVAVGDVDIPQEGKSGRVPLVTLDRAMRRLCFAMTIRNVSHTASQLIEHVYMLFSRSCGCGPTVYTGERADFLGSGYEQLKPLRPSGRDLADGFAQEYRLDAYVPSLPPGAAAQIVTELGSTDNILDAGGEVKLRLHTASGALDFPFSFMVIQTST
jgi:nucleoside 2-deoxyribosyltransferase